MAVLDHLVYAVEDLEVSCRWFADRTGVSPAIGGAHPGRGTHNALASFGSAYIELIAPDPGQPTPAGPRPFGLDAIAGEGLVAFAVRPDPADSIDQLVARARRAGYDAGPVMAMSRRRPDGIELRWRNTVPPAGGVIPFVIEWGATDMPSATAPAGLELMTFEVSHPDSSSVHAAHAALGVAVAVGTDEPGGLSAMLHGPAGALSLLPVTGEV